jgi:hypothetical protein
VNDAGPALRRGRRLLVVAVVGGVTAAVAVAAGLAHATAHRPAGTPATAGEVHTAAVVRTDLSDVRAYSGTLGYGAEQTLKGRVPGTVTWLPAPGTTVDRGKPLYKVDEKPVWLFLGGTPLYRKLDKPGIKGADVAVVKANLVALGHGAGGGAADEFTAGTVEAVKRWQRANRQPDTGVVDAGDVVVLSGPVRVATVKTQLAGSADGELMSVTSTTRAVTVPVPAGELDSLKPGDPATVALPTGAQTAGKVATISDTASTGGTDGRTGGPDQTGGGRDDQSKITVTVALDDPAKAGASGPVQVQFVAATRKGVLAVPLTALVALSEGGYAVEVRTGANRSLVAVKTGLFAKGLVEVSGPGLDAGQQVVVTS